MKTNYERAMIISLLFLIIAILVKDGGTLISILPVILTALYATIAFMRYLQSIFNHRRKTEQHFKLPELDRTSAIPETPTDEDKKPKSLKEQQYEAWLFDHEG